MSSHPGALSGGQRLLVLVGVVALGATLAAAPLPVGLAVVAVVAAALFALSKPTWAIALPFAAIPLELFVLDLGPVGLAPVQISVILAVALMLAEMITVGRLVTPKTPLDVWILLWLAVAVLGAVSAYDPPSAIKKAGMTVIFVAFYYLVVAKIHRTSTVHKLMRVLVVSSAAVGSYGVYLSYRYLATGATAGKAIIVGSEGLAVPRAGSTLGQPTVLAALMVVALPIAVSLIVSEKGSARLAAIVCGAAILVTLGFTFTRGAWLGGIAGLTVMALDKRSRRVLAVVLLLLAIAAPEAVLKRAASSTDTGRAEISHRFYFWQGALRVAEKHPVFGAGIGNFRYAYSRLPLQETALYQADHPHNFVLDLLADTGVVGLLSYGGLIAGALVLLVRRRRGDPDPERARWRLAIAASIVGTMAHQTTDSLLLEPSWNAIMWTLFGLAVVLSLPPQDAPADAAAIPADGASALASGYVGGSA